MKKETFDEDRDLVKLLSKANVKHLEVFSKVDFGPKRSKMTRLFELMRDSEFESADEIKSALYGKELKADGNFLRMYHKFREKLVNTLFFVDTNSSLFSERSKAYYVCAKRSYVTRMLLDRGWINLAISLAENTLPISIKYEFTDLNIAFLKVLVRQFSVSILNKTKLIKYNKMFSILINVYEKELDLEPIFNRLGNIENYNLLNKIKIDMPELKSAFNKSMKLLNSNPTIEALIIITRILVFYFIQIKDFNKYKKYLKLILDKITSKPFLSVGTIENIVTAQLRVAHLNNEINFAQELYNKYFNMYIFGNFNWYVGNYYYILLMIRNANYEKAQSILTSSVAIETFEKQSSFIKENFYLVQAYIYYLCKIGKINFYKEASNHFKINKFINQVPFYSRDKEGINIPIVLVQILIFIADEKYSIVIDRIESLNLYSYRHLKKVENFRSQCFIKMISEMVRADFKKQGTLFRTKKIFNKLMAIPIYAYPAAAETEIIPYEDLWEMIVERLE